MLPVVVLCRPLVLRSRSHLLRRAQLLRPQVLQAALPPPSLLPQELLQYLQYLQ
jgi:hypothetical protein